MMEDKNILRKHLTIMATKIVMNIVSPIHARIVERATRLRKVMNVFAPQDSKDPIVKTKITAILIHAVIVGFVLKPMELLFAHAVRDSRG